MKAINKKLIFGTANLSKPYGINSQKIQNHNSIKNIIEFLKKEKINFVDTAYSYGSAVKDLGKNRIQKFNIISKLPNLQSTNFKLLEEEIYKTTFEMIYNLRIKKLYGLLIHNTNNLNGIIVFLFKNCFKGFHIISIRIYFSVVYASTH